MIEFSNKELQFALRKYKFNEQIKKLLLKPEQHIIIHVEGHNMTEVKIKDKTYTVKYKHVREKAQWTEAHGMIPSAKGGTTLAYIEGDNFKLEAYAKCSVKDTYCKKTGRELATTRLHELTNSL